ncbi:integrase family protein [Ostreiculturibacter nitratireducens]|uniref:tyrosine-type recombinase/integrase n=1 Tax=Ostreiculturibacter nitratireducens TaxID=3075226 RepID=UPI0031B5BA0A
MPKMKFTRTAIEKLRPDPERDTLYWDTGTRGLGLRVTKGGVFSFICQGRVRGTTKDRRVTIGSYGVKGGLTLEEAQGRADDYRKLFQDGVDPNDLKKKHEVEMVTLGAVAEEYLAIGNLKPTTVKWINYYTDRVFADWKDKPIASINRDMVKERHAELKRGGLHGKKPAPSTANAAMVVLRTLINFAIEDYTLPDGTQLITTNPVHVLNGKGKNKRWSPEGDRTDRYIPVDRLGAVWNMLQELRQTTTHSDTLSAVDLVIFSLLCGGRKNEGAGLTWDRVHFEDDPARCYWHLKDRKQGKPINLPMPSQAIALLKERRRMTNGDFVFPSRGKTGHVTDPRATMEKVSEVAGLHLSLHDMRRTFSETSVKACRIERFRGDLLIGHKPDQRDVGANSYLDLTDLRWLYPEVQQVADWIEEQARIAAAKAASENVVDMRHA